MVSTPSLIYWCFAWLVVTAAGASGLRGWSLARQGRIAEHRRAMRFAIRLIGAFLVSYVFKALLLGREHLASWSPHEIVTLRIHESFIAVMLIAGATAWGATRRSVPSSGSRRAFLHRVCGRTAFCAALAAFFTATLLLLSMFRLLPQL